MGRLFLFMILLNGVGVVILLMYCRKGIDARIRRITDAIQHALAVSISLTKLISESDIRIHNAETRVNQLDREIASKINKQLHADDVDNAIQQRIRTILSSDEALKNILIEYVKTDTRKRPVAEIVDLVPAWILSQFMGGVESGTWSGINERIIEKTFFVPVTVCDKNAAPMIGTYDFKRETLGKEKVFATIALHGYACDCHRKRFYQFTKVFGKKADRGASTNDIIMSIFNDFPEEETLEDMIQYFSPEP